jgi:hypothetical protein
MLSRAGSSSELGAAVPRKVWYDCAEKEGDGKSSSTMWP